MPQALRIPEGINCAADYSRLAARAIAAPTLAYIDGGSGSGETLASNREAFNRLCIVPRVLRDFAAGHTRLRLLGLDLAHPVLLAPVAYQTLAHPGGELETARGAAAAQACMTCSTLSSFSLEQIAQRAGPQRWFQLYFQPRRAATLDLVHRAEAAGYGALIVTLDASIQAPSVSALRAGFQMPADLRPANLAGHPPPPQSEPLADGASRIFQGLLANAPTWDDLDWLAARTALPLVVKGVLHPDDAHRLRQRGTAAVVVSNHGGRTVDGALSSLAALPAIRRATGPDFPVLLDSGIRSGNDVFKALALGADAVMIGRLQLHALAVAGALGVAHLIRLLREELELCMALAGCPTLADIGPGALHPRKEQPSC